MYKNIINQLDDMIDSLPEDSPLRNSLVGMKQNLEAEGQLPRCPACIPGSAETWHADWCYLS